MMSLQSARLHMELMMEILYVSHGRVENLAEDSLILIGLESSFMLKECQRLPR
jgi:hypothetical protein